eukprot:TRINITY_DN8155_c0_g1_i1.p1 TRINITY_DN8155_c0_g1~~TRINITY_DN8155_c0_g1_i1.p1  ORF type:complete len:241 (+),score=35.66 TRINITY_DN8155_c0_g1_i1:62-784(+)
MCIRDSKSDLVYTFKYGLQHEEILYFFNDVQSDPTQSSFSTIWRDGQVVDKQPIQIQDIPREVIKNGTLTNIISKLPYLGYADLLQFGADNEIEAKAYFFHIVNKKRKIFTFDFKSENFQEIEPPENFNFFSKSQASALPDGKVLLCGGLNIKDAIAEVVNASYIYSPYSNSAVEVNSMNLPRYGHCVVSYKDRVYVLGGRKNFNLSSENVTSECEYYDSSSNTWNQVCLLYTSPSPRDS